MLDTNNWQIAYARLELGICLTAAQRYEEAGPLLQNGLAGIEAEHGTDHRITQYARDAVDRFQEERSSSEVLR